jgi:hypothetical protein
MNTQRRDPLAGVGDLVGLRHDVRAVRRKLEAHLFDSPFRRRPFNSRLSSALDGLVTIEEHLARLLSPRRAA